MANNVARYFLLYSSALILIWVGSLKFSAYEAMAIQPLVHHSPFLSWLYNIFDVRPFAKLLGTAEIVAGVLIALRPIAPRAAVVGSVFAIVLFFFTVTFLFSTPGVIEMGKDFPKLSGFPGQFLAKDIVLLAASVWIFVDAWTAAGGMRSIRPSR